MGSTQLINATDGAATRAAQPEFRALEAQDTLHAALRILRNPRVISTADEHRVRCYALDRQSPIEEVAVRLVHGLLSELSQAGNDSRG